MAILSTAYIGILVIVTYYAIPSYPKPPPRKQLTFQTFSSAIMEESEASSYNNNNSDHQRRSPEPSLPKFQGTRRRRYRIIAQANGQFPPPWSIAIYYLLSSMDLSCSVPQVPHRPAFAQSGRHFFHGWSGEIQRRLSVTPISLPCRAIYISSYHRLPANTRMYLAQPTDGTRLGRECFSGIHTVGQRLISNFLIVVCAGA